MVQLVSSFRNWLKIHHYSQSTIDNYVTDVNKYLAICPSSPDIFSQNQLTNYINVIKGQNNFQRSLASLNKFCQFGLDQKIISAHPLKTIVSQVNSDQSISIPQILNDFQSSLVKHHKTTNTITNYLNDIKQFIAFCQSQTAK